MNIKRSGLDRGATTLEDCSAVEFEGVSKRFLDRKGKTIQALSDATFRISGGEFVSLLGPSGCGKSTVLKICAGLVPQSDGVIRNQGHLGPARPGEFGMVFQGPALLPWRTVLQNVLLPAELLRIPIDEATNRAMSLLERMRLHDGTTTLADIAQKYPSELSGGMRQRVSVVRALVHNPGTILMDEPFGALDAMTRDELNMDLQRLHMGQSKTVLFVTHSISEAVLLSDRILVMSARPGRVVADVKVPVRRPRQLGDASTSEFGEIVTEIRGMLGSRNATFHSGPEGGV